jgi:hypothetical protein
MLLVFILILSPFLQVHGIAVFACDFEKKTMCEMQNGVWFDPNLPLYNFTISTAENVPDKELAPTTDHTYNSSAGHFLHRPLNAPHTGMHGRVSIPMFQQHEHMCLNFAYYVKSSASINNGTYLTVYIRGCYGTALWSMNTDDTLGWKTAETQLLDLRCNVTIRFDVMPGISNAVSVALDDVIVDICSRYRTTPVPTDHSTQLATNICLVAALFINLLATV